MSNNNSFEFTTICFQNMHYKAELWNGLPQTAYVRVLLYVASGAYINNMYLADLNYFPNFKQEYQYKFSNIRPGNILPRARAGFFKQYNEVKVKLLINSR